MTKMAKARRRLRVTVEVKTRGKKKFCCRSKRKKVYAERKTEENLIKKL